MKEQFLFFCTNIGNEKLLKEEIRIFYPDFSFSYSRKGFLTYKNKGIQYDLDSISQLILTFSTRAGICLGKTNLSDLAHVIQSSCRDLGITLDKCIVHNFSINTEYKLFADKILNREINEYAPINKVVINIMALSADELWYGVHRGGKTTTNYPNSVFRVDIPDDAPSKSYEKIAQAVELLGINLKRTDCWLDFGSAPGGASHYLLGRCCEVWGIDPAKMDQAIMKNSRYKHLSKSVQDLSQEELPNREIQWIHVDLNLNPKQVIKEVLRLSKKYSSSLRGIVFTIQIVKMEYIQYIEEFEDSFLEWGFSDVISRQLPSHKNEYVILAKR
jgi:hypothetical protein